MFSSCTSRLALVTVAGALVLAVSAPGASAATSRYVAPAGTGTDCSSAKPCKLEDAVKASGAGDEVIVKPGNYILWQGLSTPTGITIHGIPGQQRPILQTFVAGGIYLQNSTLRYADVYQADQFGSAVTAKGSTIDQVNFKGGTSAECVVATRSSTIRNSVVIARSSDGSGVCADALQSSNTSIVRNVTAVVGTGLAIEATAIDSTAYVTLSVNNTIAKTDGGIGLYVAGAAGSHAKLTVSNTNYANYKRVGDFGTVFVDAGKNQGTLPLFVNPALDDYRQRAGSVTIDAGASLGQLGAYDIDGDPRSIGAPDIGADEFVFATGGGGPTPSPGGGTGGTGSGGSGSGGTSGFAGVKLVSTALTLKRGLVTVKLSCPAATAGRCTGRTKLTARRKRAGSSAVATVKLGRARFSIAAGGQKKLKVRVSRAGRRMFAHKRRLRGWAASAAHDAAGLSKTTSSRVTIRKGTR
jgi:hypothetical protein